MKGKMDRGADAPPGYDTAKSAHPRSDQKLYLLGRAGSGVSRGAAAPLLTPGYATAHRVTHCYPYCIVFSSILLQHILDNSQSIGRQLEVKSLMETVHAFNVTNKEMSPTRNKPAGYSQCVQCCKVCADFFVREES